MRPKHQVFAMKFADVYPLYVHKAERKNRTKAEVDQIIRWLTGYNQAGMQQQIKQGDGGCLVVRSGNNAAPRGIKLGA